MTTSDIRLCTLYSQSYHFKMKNVTTSPSCLSTLGTTRCFRIDIEIRTVAKTLHVLTSYLSCSSHQSLLPSAPQPIVPWPLKALCSLLPWPLPIPGTFSPGFQIPLSSLAPYPCLGFQLHRHSLGMASQTSYYLIAHSYDAVFLCFILYHSIASHLLCDKSLSNS